MLILAGVGAGPSGDFQSIASVTVGSGGQSTITFSSIPSTYKHLQIRGLAIFSGTVGGGRIAFNGDNASGNYSAHSVYGSGTGTASNSSTSQNFGAFNNASGTSSSAPNAMVLDILDYSNTDKHKTLRSSYGWDANGTGYIELCSSCWRSTSAITSIDLSSSSSTFAQYSSFALYGIKG
jgi:hypothetical protein